MDGQKASDILTHLVVTAEMQAGLDGALEELTDREGARGAILVERSGVVLAKRGQGPVLDTAVAALVAGIFKSLSALSGLLGEGEVATFQQVGPNSLTVFNLLTQGDALVASFSPTKPEKDVGGALNIAIAKVTPLLKKARSGSPTGLKIDPSSLDGVFGDL